MGITVREALTLPELTQVQVLAGDKGLDREIQRVSVMEVPDISAFIEEGELLLTTAYPIVDKQGILEELIPLLHQRGLVGLAIKPERYIHEIPPIMLQQADELDFPLLKLPNTPSFTIILNAIMSRILHLQASLLEYSDSVHRCLTDLVLNGHGIPSLVRKLAELIAFPIALSNADFQLLEVSEDDELLRQQAVQFISDLQVRKPPVQKQISTRIERFREDGFPSVLVFPVKAGHYLFGYVYILELEGHLPPAGVVAVEQATVALALEFQKRKAIQEHEQRFLDDFVRDLLNGNIHSTSEMEERGKVHGWRAEFPQVILAVEAVAERNVPMPDLLINKIVIQQRLRDIILHHSALNVRNRLLARFGDVLVLLYLPSTTNEEVAKHEACDVARRILNRLMDDMSGEHMDINIGICRPCKDSKDLQEGFRQVTEALYVQRQTQSVGRIVHYDDLGIYRLLARVSDIDELRRYCDERLSKITAYDEKNGTELLSTLRGIIEANGNMNLAAKHLFIHYNTLRYRAKKIEDLTGVKFHSWESIVEFSVALKADLVLRIHNVD